MWKVGGKGKRPAVQLPGEQVLAASASFRSIKMTLHPPEDNIFDKILKRFGKKRLTRYLRLSIVCKKTWGFTPDTFFCLPVWKENTGLKWEIPVERKRLFR